MSSNLAILQIWNLWSQYLIPYFQECNKSLMSDSVEEIILLYGSNLSLPFQKELSEFLLVQAVQIRSQYESVKTVEKTPKGLRLKIKNVCSDPATRIFEKLGISNEIPLYREHPEAPNYLIYNDGRVYSRVSNVFMSPSVVSGYYAIGIYINKIRKAAKIHRLVASLFVNNPDPINLTMVNHKDHNKFNNSYENLEWVNNQVNSNHAITRQSYKPTRVRHVQQIDLNGRIVATFGSITDASKHTGISQWKIGNCCRGRFDKSYDPKGVQYIWKYIEETEIHQIPENAKPIPNYNNYLVTPDGKIYSFAKRGYLSQVQDCSGYMTVLLHATNKGGIRFLVHRLVASTYLPNDETREFVNHLDNDRRNNHVNNLQYVTKQENTKHSFETGNCVKFKKSVKMMDLITENVLRIFDSLSEASRQTGIDRSSIGACCNKRYKSAGGYLWQFEGDTVDH
jgi:hypothetical protein